MELKNYKILIFGSAGFLGSEISHCLIKEGAECIFLDKDDNKLKNLKKKLSNNISSKNFIKVDITNEKNLIKIKKKLKKNFKYFDGIINLTANDPKVTKKNSFKSFQDTSLNDFNNDLRVGLSGAMLICKHFVNLLKRDSYSSVVNIASDLSIISPDHRIYSNKKKNFNSKPISYSIIKNGIIGLNKYLATYYANEKIRFNTISPGGIALNQNKRFKKKISYLIPMGRMAKINEINSAIVYFISKKSSYTTGHNLIIDGGRSTW